MPLTPVLSPEEYIEQEYLFRALRERIEEGVPAQEALDHIQAEILSITLLPYATQFLLGELKHTGELGPAMRRLGHYFSPMQALVVSRAEQARHRLTFVHALLVLEQEARFRSASPTPQGLFVFQFETLSRNNLGFADGLDAMQGDGFYDESWRAYLGLVRQQLGVRELAELVFARSAWYVVQRRRSDPAYEPRFPVLFGEKEGKIAAANRGKDPMFLFAALQRQLSYPQVPRPPRADPRQDEIDELRRKLKSLETRLGLLEAETKGDLSPFYVPKDAT